MASRTIIHLECDACAAAGKHTDGEQLTIGNLAKLDVCEQHRRKLQPLVDLLAKYGRLIQQVPPTPDKARAPHPRFKCGECDKIVALGSKTDHARRHGKAGVEVEWARV